MLFDEAEGGELFDHAAVEGGLGVVVDVRERLLGGKLAKRSRPSSRRRSAVSTSSASSRSRKRVYEGFALAASSSAAASCSATAPRRR